jgi:enoyl-CoA hydratase/carnithine racemase
MIRSVTTLPVPVIARINGPAAGVGLSLALAADLIYAAESTYLLLPFVSIGLMPDGGATAIVAAAVGRAQAAALALLGERLPVVEAAAAGLITKVLPDDQLDAHVDTVAAKLAKGPRRALELTKAAVNAAALTELDAALEREKEGQIELQTSPDFIEGATAMLTRRQPNFGS